MQHEKVIHLAMTGMVSVVVLASTSPNLIFGSWSALPDDGLVFWTDVPLAEPEAAKGTGDAER